MSNVVTGWTGFGDGGMSSGGTSGTSGPEINVIRVWKLNKIFRCMK